MKLWSKLPPDRAAEGQFWVTDDAGAICFGPVRCRGEADRSTAVAHGNPIEDPTRAYGDHPAGVYKLVDILWHPVPAHSYGPAFFKLDPLSGEALGAKTQGRSGIGIHGGDPGPDDTLRPTFGCLRLTNADCQAVADMVEPVRITGSLITYTCAVHT